MYLSNQDIEEYQAMGLLSISPWIPRHLQAASYDLSLGDHWLSPGKPPEESISMKDDFASHLTEYEQPWFELQPGECVLGTTLETVYLSKYFAGEVFGRSSIGRRWLTVHVTAGFVDPGFNGQLTLEIVNHSPYAQRLQSGLRMAQLVVSTLRSPSTKPYGTAGSKYQHQQGATASKLHLDLEVARAA